MPWPREAGARRALRRMLLRIFGPPVAMYGIWLVAGPAIDLLIQYVMEGKWVFSPWRMGVGAGLVVIGGAMSLLGWLGGRGRWWGGRGSGDALRDGMSGGDGLGRVGAAEAVELPCPRCLHQNEPGARFCVECGSALAASWECPNCRWENELGAVSCGRCGRESGAAGESQRRKVGT